MGGLGRRQHREAHQDKMGMWGWLQARRPLIYGSTAETTVVDNVESDIYNVKLRYSQHWILDIYTSASYYHCCCTLSAAPVYTATEWRWLRTAGIYCGRTAVKYCSAVYTIADEWLRSAAPPGMDVGCHIGLTNTTTLSVANCAATASRARASTHHKIA